MEHLLVPIASPTVESKIIANFKCSCIDHVELIKLVKDSFRDSD